MNLYPKFLTIISLILLLLVTVFSISAQDQNNPSDQELDVSTRSAVIESVIKRFNQSYIFPDIAQAIERSVRERISKGEYNKITSPSVLAQTLTANLREVSKDTHVEVVYSEKPLPPMNEIEKAETVAEREKRRRSYARINNGFLKVERLPGNIGFLDIDLFVDPAFAGNSATAAMNFLANTDALIVDLRYCPGGNGEMVTLISGYFFADSIHLGDYYQREDDLTKQSWTSPFVAGQRYLNKDVYILTSKRTHSAAEAFAYNLQNLKRATIVGETTRGGAHPVGRYRIDEHFGVQVPVGRVINNITKTDWEGKGVTPDIQITADQALKMAQLTALKRLLEKNSDQETANDIKQLIEKLEKEINAK